MVPAAEYATPRRGRFRARRGYGQKSLAEVASRTSVSLRERATIRETLFGSRRRIAATTLAGIVVFGAVAAGLGLIGVPTVVGVENRFGPVNDSHTVVETDLAVANPNPVGVHLGGTTVDYTVYANDVALATGGREGVALGTGTTTLEFTSAIRNERIPAWWVSHVSETGGRERTAVTVDATVSDSVAGDRAVSLRQERTVETDLLGQFRSNESRPVNASSPLVSDPVLIVRRTDAAWGTVTDAGTPIDVEMLVYNPKTVPYVVTEIGYAVTMNGVPVGNGTTDDSYAIPGGEERLVGTRVVVDNDRLDDWWVTHLRRNQVTDLRIEFSARIELPAGQTVELPLRRLTYERRIETDLFGTKPATDGGTNGSATRTTAETTADDGLLALGPRRALARRGFPSAEATRGISRGHTAPGRVLR